MEDVTWLILLISIIWGWKETKCLMQMFRIEEKDNPTTTHKGEEG